MSKEKIFKRGSFALLSEAQKRPLESFEEESRNILVSAGAGSGKTMVLTHAFAYLVLTGKARPEEILAITFTEKAASEMKERLVRLFSDLGEEALRREVEEAYVSTLHSFASRLLKEYALEAGIDPEFQVITEDISAELAKEAFEELTEELMAEGESKREFWPLFLAAGSTVQLKEELLALRGQLMNSFAATNEKEFSDPDLAHHGEELVQYFEQALSKMENSFGLKPEEAPAYGELREAVSGFRKVLKGEVSITEAGLEKYEMDLRTGRKAGEWKDFFKPVRKKFQEEALRFIKDTETRMLRSLLRRFLVRFEEKFTVIKRRQNFLDFDDLLKELLRFLRSDSFAAQHSQQMIREKFKFILMDELQDSNRIEREILRLISNGKNLFLVGDIKQSIYGFRQADVGIFKEAADEVRKASGYFPLTESRRSCREIIDFINGFFGQHVFGEMGIEGLPYEPLTLPNDRLTAEGQAAVECLLVWGSDTEQQADKTKRQFREADAIAGKIAELTQSKEKICYGDIAILLRNFTDVSLYERALRQRGIPCVVVAGRGFYQKTEILDIVGFLKLLESPLDNIALIGVLRSPLVSLSDDAIYQLSKTPAASKDKGSSRLGFWSVLHSSAFQKQLVSTDKTKVQQFLKFWHALREEKNRLSLASLIRKIIHGTSYETKVLLEYDGQRKFSNLEKMVEMARVFDKRALGLAAFLTHLEEATVKEVRESEAQADSRDCENVQILTIHKAKGLEFKAIFYANFDAGSLSQKPLFNFSSEYGFGICRELPDGEDEKDYRYYKNEERKKNSESEEAKRLFYVACTRAKKYLFLSSAPSVRKQYRTRLNGLLKYCGYDSLEEASGKEGQAGLRLNWIEVDSEGEGHPMSSLLDEPFFKKALLAKRPIRLEKTASFKKMELNYEKVLSSKFPQRPGIETSVTSLLDFEECPQKYYLRHVLKFPSALFEEPVKESEVSLGREETDFRARDFGTYFHHLLEHWDYSRKPLEYYEQKLKTWDPDVPALWRERLGEELYRFALSDLADDLKDAREIQRELNLEWRPKKFFLVRGQIDLFYLSHAGEWNLVDYKTNYLGDLKKTEELTDYYRLQLSVYGALLMRILKLKKLNCSLYYSQPGKWVRWHLEWKEAVVIEKQTLSILERIARHDFCPPHNHSCDFCSDAMGS